MSHLKRRTATAVLASAVLVLATYPATSVRATDTTANPLADAVGQASV